MLPGAAWLTCLPRAACPHGLLRTLHHVEGGSSSITGASSFGIICSMAQPGPFCRISPAFFSQAEARLLGIHAGLGIHTAPAPSPARGIATRTRRRKYPPTEQPTKLARIQICQFITEAQQISGQLTHRGVAFSSPGAS